jgi:transposase-like protein
MYESGLSLRHIERLTGISHMTVYRRLARLGIIRKNTIGR